jgi:uncharacterized Zn finger protein
VLNGQRYVGAVRSLDVQPPSLSALLQDTARRPCRVDIHFASNLAGARHVSPNCSCPVGGCCEHAATVLLAAIDSGDHTQRVNPERLTWLPMKEQCAAGERST